MEKYLFGPYNAYFFDLEGVRQWFERRKKRYSRSIIWKNWKGGTKVPEIVKMIKNLSFCGFLQKNWKKIFFVKIIFCVKYLFGPYNPYFFDLEGVRQWFERRKARYSRSVIWKNRKRGTKAHEIVKVMKKIKFFWVFTKKKGKKYFS